jgi:hypothetical protein
MRSLLIFLALSGVAHAETKNEVTIGSYTRALHASSANALTDDSLAGPAFGYARKLPLALAPKLELWATAHLAGGVVQGEMFQSLATDVSNVQFSFGGRARYRLWRFVHATARLDAGAQKAWLELKDMAGHSAADSGWGAVATAALGIDLLPIELRRFGLGFRAELGYVATSAIELTAKSEGAPDDTIVLDRMAASLGHLDIGGRYFAFQVSLQF